MKKLILAEKPSVAKDLAKVIGATQQHKNYYEGSHVIVTWAYGHLLTLQMPEDVDKTWQSWQMDTLPMIPKKLGIKPLPKTYNQLKVIQTLVHRKDVESIVIATDAGREGELVARWILQYTKNVKPVERLWISSQTDKAIKEGFQRLQSSQAFDRLFDSALSRAKADWLIGLNVTRALSVKYQDNLSAGRVQTPTLALVREQEEKIAKFIPEKYFTVNVDVSGIKGQFKQLFKTKEQAQQFIKSLSNGVISKMDKIDKRQAGPLLYDLTQLQTEANNRFGFSAKKTLSLVQSLYEVHKVSSYPRTDSCYLTADLKHTMSERLQALVKVDERVKIFLKNGSTVKQKQVFNNDKVGDHHALIPTETTPNFNRMTSDEVKIYMMIVERFLTIFCADYQYVTHKVTVSFDTQQLVLTYDEVIDNGWVPTVSKIALPHWQVGQRVNPQITIKEQLTTPPKAISEGTLLSQMAKFNLGTPATRAEIIERLITGELMVRSDKALKVTPKGQQLLKLVHPSLVSAQLTQKWEVQLEKIAKGQAKSSAFLTEIENETRQMVSDIKGSDVIYKDFNLTNKRCPDCDALLREKQTKQGAFYVCTSQTCHYRRRKDLKVTNKRCGVCHKKMVLIDGKNGAYFKCQTCQISQKIEQETARSKKVTKHETKRLMQKINNDHVEAENPFAAALKSLK